MHKCAHSGNDSLDLFCEQIPKIQLPQLYQLCFVAGGEAVRLLKAVSSGGLKRWPTVSPSQTLFNSHSAHQLNAASDLCSPSDVPAPHRITYKRLRICPQVRL